MSIKKTQHFRIHDKLIGHAIKMTRWVGLIRGVNFSVATTFVADKQFHFKEEAMLLLFIVQFTLYSKQHQDCVIDEISICRNNNQEIANSEIR